MYLWARVRMRVQIGRAAGRGWTEVAGAYGVTRCLVFRRVLFRSMPAGQKRDQQQPAGLTLPANHAGEIRFELLHVELKLWCHVFVHHAPPFFFWPPRPCTYGRGLG